MRHAHAAGIIHCDVKPANILVDKVGHAKVADFGIARLLQGPVHLKNSRGPFGTPIYSSPEHFRRGAPIDARTDIYSLGATLYHMFTGRPPFTGTDFDSMMQAHLHEPFVSPDHFAPDLSLGLCQIIEKCLAKSPHERYQSVEDVIVDLRAVADGKSPPLVGSDVSFLDLAEMESEAPSLERRPNPIRGALFWILLITSLAFNVILALALWSG